MNVTPEQIHWLGGALLGALSIIVAAIGLLLRAAFKVGANAEKFATGLTMLTDLKKAVEELPVIKQRLGVVEEMTSKVVSDIRDLLRERRGSRPDPDELNGEAEE